MTTRQHDDPGPTGTQADSRPDDDRHDTDSLEELRDRAASRDRDRAVDDEANPADDPDSRPEDYLPAGTVLLDADTGTEPAVRIVPRQADEFTCTRCFLIAHLSRRARTNPDVCRDCA